jgi:DNA-binding MarR family transcriptional regulator
LTANERAVGDVESEHTANLLGALSVVLHDRLMEAISEAIGQSESAAAALSWLENFVDQPSVGLLHRMLGLTPSGAVRLVDRLEAEGYLERRGGADGRSTRVHLTRTGRRAARQVTAARAQVLDHALTALSTEERQVLDRLLSRLLVGMMRGPDARRFMCRLCNARACGHAEGRCPVRNAARERFGSATTTHEAPTS